MNNGGQKMDSIDAMESSSPYIAPTAESLDPAASAALAGITVMILVVYAVILVIMVVSLWRLFVKANKPGWAAIVTIYNTIVQLDVAGRPWLWVLVMAFVPIFGFWLAIVSVLDFMKSYGKSAGFAVFAIFFPIIAYPMMALSKSTTYVGPAAKGLDGFMPAPDRAPVAPQQ